jgi:hypothetical protein
MNVLPLVATVTLMLTVPTLLEASPVNARMDIKEAESLVLVGLEFRLFLNQIYLKYRY